MLLLICVIIVIAAAVGMAVLQLSTLSSQKAVQGSGVDKLEPNRNQPTLYTYNVLGSFPHDCNAFTQGLVYESGQFFEGTGLTGKSSLRRVEIESGKVLQEQKLDPDLFGEGIAVVDGKLFQLTWQDGLAFQYDKSSFAEQRRYAYDSEGWGLTFDGKRLIMSDGSSFLTFRDPETFGVTGRIEVTDPKGPVVRLNELEYIHGWVFANIWQTNNIAIIDPETGQVVAWLQLTSLLDFQSACPYVDVLNGIAYDATNDRLFVTGKLWPRIYQIELLKK